MLVTGQTVGAQKTEAANKKTKDKETLTVTSKS